MGMVTMQKKELNENGFEFAYAALSCVGDGVISADAAGKIVFLNKKAEEIVGWRANEAIGKDFEQIFTVSHADAEEPAGIGRYEKNVYIISKNKTKKYISAACSSMARDDGSIHGTVVAFRILESLDNIKNLLDQIPSIVWKNDSELKCDYVNKSWTDFTGVTKEKALNTKWMKAIHPDDLCLG
jgi:PAS domain S-box-containing protein